MVSSGENETIEEVFRRWCSIASMKTWIHKVNQVIFAGTFHVGWNLDIAIVVGVLPMSNI